MPAEAKDHARALGSNRLTRYPFGKQLLNVRSHVADSITSSNHAAAEPDSQHLISGHKPLSNLGYGSYVHRKIVSRPRKIKLDQNYFKSDQP
jgi:hypothetical protein